MTEQKKNARANTCVLCGSFLYRHNSALFCCKLKCPNFGLSQLGAKTVFGLLEYEKSKNSKWVKIIEDE